MVSETFQIPINSGKQNDKRPFRVKSKANN